MTITSLRSIERYPSAVVVKTAPFAPRSMLAATSDKTATIDYGERTLQINEVSFSVAPGVRVRATAIDPHDPSDFTHWMEGQVTSYDGRQLTLWADALNASAQGETYSKWNVGVIGQRGEKGERGEIGPKGDQGPPNGPTGPTGETGPAGINGVPGPTGATGAAAAITVGTTTTVAAGTNANVTQAGTAQNRILDFFIPEGQIGPTGPTGGIGPAGADGTSVAILGQFPDLPTLQATHPTPNLADGAIIDGDLWFWDGGNWQNAGPIQGPIGPTGPPGPASIIPGPTGSTGPTGATGSTGTNAIVTSVAHPFVVAAGELQLAMAYPLMVNAANALAINLDDGTY